MSKISVVLFDLDGTLLPMDQDEFIKKYFANLQKTLKTDIGPQLMTAMTAMMKNDGKKTNEETFWENLGDCKAQAKAAFDEFYEDGYLELEKLCRPTDFSAKTVKLLKNAGIRTVLATNPVFPLYATEKRIAWAGLAPSDFEFVTAYENSSFCKPSVGYYEEIVKRLDVSPENCLMVGNDTEEDMAAAKIGMKTFLLTDCLVNRKNADVSRYPQGGFAELEKFLENGEII